MAEIRYTKNRLSHQRAAIAEEQWLLVVRRAGALWHLELPDRSVLYLCHHRLHHSGRYDFGWKEEYGVARQRDGCSPSFFYDSITASLRTNSGFFFFGSVHWRDWSFHRFACSSDPPASA